MNSEPKIKGSKLALGKGNKLMYFCTKQKLV